MPGFKIALVEPVKPQPLVDAVPETLNLNCTTGEVSGVFVYRDAAGNRLRSDPVQFTLDPDQLLRALAFAIAAGQAQGAVPVGDLTQDV